MTLEHVPKKPVARMTVIRRGSYDGNVKTVSRAEVVAGSAVYKTYSYIPYTCDAVITVDEDALLTMILRAMNNKSLQAIDGPLIVKVFNLRKKEPAR